MHKFIWICNKLGAAKSIRILPLSPSRGGNGLSALERSPPREGAGGGIVQPVIKS